MPESNSFLSNDHHKIYLQYYKVSRKYAHLIKNATTINEIKRLAKPSSFEAWKNSTSKLGKAKQEKKVKPDVGLTNTQFTKKAKKAASMKYVRKGGNGQDPAYQYLHEFLEISKNNSFDSRLETEQQPPTRKSLKDDLVNKLRNKTPTTNLLLKCIPTNMTTNIFIQLFNELPPENSIKTLQSKINDLNDDDDNSLNDLTVAELQSIFRYNSLIALTEQEPLLAVENMYHILHIYYWLNKSNKVQEHNGLFDKYILLIKNILNLDPAIVHEHFEWGDYDEAMEVLHALRQMAMQCIVFERKDLAIFKQNLETYVIKYYKANLGQHPDWIKMYRKVANLKDPETCIRIERENDEAYYDVVGKFPVFLKMYIDLISCRVQNIDPEETKHSGLISIYKSDGPLYEEAKYFIPEFNKMVANIQKEGKYIFINDTFIQFYKDLSEALWSLCNERVSDLRNSTCAATLVLHDDNGKLDELVLDKMKEEMANNVENFWKVYVEWWYSKGNTRDYKRYTTNYNVFEVDQNVQHVPKNEPPQPPQTQVNKPPRAPLFVRI